MALIWETTDRLGRLVRLTEAGWSHIAAQRGSLVLTPDEVRRALESPIRVTIDATYSQRECFYADRRSGGWLKVVVHYRPVPPQGTWDGAVVTAHPEKKIKQGEVQRWP